MPVIPGALSFDMVFIKSAISGLVMVEPVNINKERITKAKKTIAGTAVESIPAERESTSKL